MSELMSLARGREREFGWQLLATVSTLALFAAVCGAGKSMAAGQDADRPTVWIELGGQLEQLSGGQELFSPSFAPNLPNNFFSPLSVQKPSTMFLRW